MGHKDTHRKTWAAMVYLLEVGAMVPRTYAPVGSFGTNKSKGR